MKNDGVSNGCLAVLMLILATLFILFAGIVGRHLNNRFDRIEQQCK